MGDAALLLEPGLSKWGCNENEDGQYESSRTTQKETRATGTMKVKAVPILIEGPDVTSCTVSGNVLNKRVLKNKLYKK